MISLFKCRFIYFHRAIQLVGHCPFVICYFKINRRFKHNGCLLTHFRCSNKKKKQKKIPWKFEMKKETRVRSIDWKRRKKLIELNHVMDVRTPRQLQIQNLANWIRANEYDRSIACIAYLQTGSQHSKFVRMLFTSLSCSLQHRKRYERKRSTL